MWPCYVVLVPFALVIGFPIARWFRSMRGWKFSRVYWCCLLVASSASVAGGVLDLMSLSRLAAPGPESGFAAMDFAFVRVPRFVFWFFPSLPVLCGALWSCLIRRDSNAEPQGSRGMAIFIGIVVGWSGSAGVLRIILDWVLEFER